MPGFFPPPQEGHQNPEGNPKDQPSNSSCGHGPQDKGGGWGVLHFLGCRYDRVPGRKVQIHSIDKKIENPPKVEEVEIVYLREITLS